MKLKSTGFQIYFEMKNIHKSEKSDKQGYYIYSLDLSISKPFKQPIRHIIVREKNVERLKSFIWTTILLKLKDFKKYHNM